MRSPRFLFIALLAACASTAAVSAETPQGPPPGGGQRMGPPPEAVAACKGKAAGDPASFTGRRGETVTGTCIQLENGVLAARPANMPPPPPGGASAPPAR